MQIELVQSMPWHPDIVVRFVPTNTNVSFWNTVLQASYDAVFSGDTLTLSHREIRSLRLPIDNSFCTVLLIGFSSNCSTPFDDFRAACAAIGTAITEYTASRILIDRLDTVTFAPEAQLLEQLGASLPLCEYAFDRYHTEKIPRPTRTVAVLAAPEGYTAMNEGHVLAESIMIARDLVNELAEVLTPEELARQCQALGQMYGFSVEVLDESSCDQLGMGLFLAVARGSSLPPCLIVMRWDGADANQPPIALVGKGITYDSGGLSLKTSGMESMRFDMNGAAAVIGAMCALARQKVTRNVVAVIAACENMIGSRSYRNGEVLRSMNGQTVFVHNTDAEGRLTMADAMTYCIRRFQPAELIEIAGLTGSVCNFFGSVCAAALTTQQDMFDRLVSLMPRTGEKFAQMPAFPEYRQLLRSPYADLDNAPAGGPGGILAGLFLASFHEDVPFLHLDLGAMPFTSKKTDGQPEGATGFGVRSLYYYVKGRIGS